jgi:hypothetical protein
MIRKECDSDQGPPSEGRGRTACPSALAHPENAEPKLAVAVTSR